MATFAAARAALLALLVDGGEYWINIGTRHHGPYDKVGAVDSVMKWAAGAATGTVATVEFATTKTVKEGSHVNYAPTGHAPGESGQVFTATATATATGPAGGQGPTVVDVP